MKNSPNSSKNLPAVASAEEISQLEEEALFPIVGIGASAGGLEAFSQLLTALPEDTGMAYVLVQHLDPNHESGLSGLLRKVARMPIEEAVHNTAVEPNHIYVIPPNVSMSIAKGVLQLTPREDTPKPFLSIDHFLCSLAKDQQEYALGVVLSGTGTDGTHGLEEIKAAGGIAFAQDEASAKYTGMPLSAMQSGCVDFILPPAGIAKELTRIGRHPYLGRLRTETDQGFAISEDHYRKIIGLLRTNVGVDFTAYRDTTIKRRILRRMALHAYKGLAEYINLLENKPDEVKELYHDLLINVTSFFREPDAFEALKNIVFPELVKEKDSSSEIRIWVPGCSTGQEAFSLAMALLEFLDRKMVHPKIQIFATDLSDERSLARAREGLYPKNIETDVSPTRLQRFFNKEGEGYRISKQIREICIFAKHNVTADPPFSKMDLISCRNLLIYLAPPLQKRVIPTFHYALNPGGFLMLGASETVGGFTDMFAAVDQKRRIYVRKAVVIREYPHFTVKDFQMDKTNRTGIPAATSADWQREADRIVLNKYTPPGVLVNDNLDILQFRGRTSPYLEAPPGEPSHNLMRMACEGLFPVLRKTIDDCRRQNTAVHRPGVQIRRNGELSKVEIQVIPVTLPNSGEKCFLVLFEASGVPASPVKSEDNNTTPEPDEIARLRQELASLHEYLQSTVEQKDAYNEELQASSEAILSSNEEMQSTNEELETAKEELQSINEELTTVNEQLSDRNKELNRLNSELKEARDYAEAVVDTVREPLIILNADLRVQKANESFYRKFQVDPKHTENHFFYALGDGQWDIPELRRRLEKILPEKMVLEDYTIRHAFTGIGSKVMRINARRLAQKDPEPLILVAIEDVTERTWMEDELRQSTRKMADAECRKDEFLAMLAHELRNPLAPIRNAVQVMKLPDASAKRVSEARTIIENQLNQVIRLVDDLLDMSRITSGKIELRIERVELATVVQSAVETSRPLMEAAGHTLKVALPKEHVWLQGDSARLAQALSNLLNNSAKYTKGNGRIELTAECQDNTALIHIKDNGIGISADMLPRIFGMFSQVDSSIERAQGGLGIGLTLVKTLVELHGGSVKAHSEGIGRGSEFTVCLPLSSPPDDAKKPTAQKKKPSYKETSSKERSGKSVLVVDDNENSAKTMGWMLELMFGHTVQRAHDGPSAIAAAKSFLPDLVLLDIGLPGMNGYEICRAMRRDPLLKNTMIVALTGWGQKEHRQLSREAGFDAHLVKPVSPETLQNLLESLEEGELLASIA